MKWFARRVRWGRRYSFWRWIWIEFYKVFKVQTAFVFGCRTWKRNAFNLLKPFHIYNMSMLSLLTPSLFFPPSSIPAFVYLHSLLTTHLFFAIQFSTSRTIPIYGSTTPHSLIPLSQLGVLRALLISSKCLIRRPSHRARYSGIPSSGGRGFTSEHDQL